MTPEEANGYLGGVIYESEHYQVRATEKDNGLHIYSLRKSNKGIELPRGFVLGSNSLYHERYWS